MNKILIVILLSSTFTFTTMASANQKRKPSSDCAAKALSVAIEQFNKDYNYPHRKPIVTQEESTIFKVEIPQGKNSDIGDIYYHVELNNSCTTGTAIEDK